ncbi:hypothetical protein [Pasteurella multocida]|uniref:hypothetical protein n=1 Tax=Pasteurella multocida TaxID=747 RepID=UPI00230113CC|nr:hypothetical protein [Pasteurella multocida]MDA5614058.1 hypothetical protein [Pasteurella multocida]MDA5621731.1 hypothetical protein [Pasteurella multocida subsp. multocida]
MKGYEITLEDQGQDFTKFITDENGIILEALPCQTWYWKGAEIPLTNQKLGDFCMIHHPPEIQFGCLKYKVLAIKKINY